MLYNSFYRDGGDKRRRKEEPAGQPDQTSQIVAQTSQQTDDRTQEGPTESCKCPYTVKNENNTYKN